MVGSRSPVSGPSCMRRLAARRPHPPVPVLGPSSGFGLVLCWDEQIILLVSLSPCWDEQILLLINPEELLCVQIRQREARFAHSHRTRGKICSSQGDGVWSYGPSFVARFGVLPPFSSSPGVSHPPVSPPEGSHPSLQLWGFPTPQLSADED